MIIWGERSSSWGVTQSGHGCIPRNTHDLPCKRTVTGVKYGVEPRWREFGVSGEFSSYLAPEIIPKTSNTPLCDCRTILKSSEVLVLAPQAPIFFGLLPVADAT